MRSPLTTTREQSLIAATRESLCTATKTQHSQKQTTKQQQQQQNRWAPRFEVGGNEELFNEYRFSALQDEKIVAQQCEHTYRYWSVQFKMVDGKFYVM